MMNLMQPLACAALLLAAAPAVLAQTPRSLPDDQASCEAAIAQRRDGLGNFFAKLASGRPVRIAYLGGSITAAEGWRVKTFQWLEEQSSGGAAQISAAIGGTGSRLGVFRLQHDVLRHQPDLLFVEFAVNDTGAPPEDVRNAMEGIVRKTWAADSTTDICFIYTFVSNFLGPLGEGNCPPSIAAHEQIATHYGISAINVALPVVQLQKAGKLVIQPPPDEADLADDVIVFSEDAVHPRDAGHEIYRDVIVERLKAWRETDEPVDHASKLKTPLSDDHLQHAKMAAVDRHMLSGDWRQLSEDHALVRRFGNRTGAVWQTETPGDSLIFKFRGSYAALYDLVGPDGGMVTITVDGETRGPTPRFDRYCTYHRLATLELAAGLDPEAVHEVTVTVHPDQPARSIVTDREKDKPGFNPADYDGRYLRVGRIMVLGDIEP